MQITYWHRLAQLFLDQQLTMPEIAKTMIIASLVGMIEHNPDVPGIGVNVLDNSALNDALVMGLLIHLPENQAVSYADLGELLNFTQRVVGNAINRLVNRQEITRQTYGSAGAFYTVTGKVNPLPHWIEQLTRALVELRYNPELKAQVVEECSHIEFRRGMEVLQQELREKFYRRK